MVNLRVIAVIVSGLAVTACDDADKTQRHMTAADDAVGIASSETENAADRDWAELTSSGPRSARLPEEASLTYFMREVELSDIRRRELGLRFWNKYPEDPRRYKWLLLTVHMPPHYARDIHEWAQNETRIEPNGAAIDVRALRDWERRYPALRRAFWGDASVTDEQRRALWSGELSQSILRMQEAVARGENPDTASLMKGVVDFAAAYPQPYSEIDQPRHYSAQRGLYWAVFNDAAALRIDRATQLAFAERLQATGNAIAAGFGNRAADRLQQDQSALPTQPHETEMARAWQEALPRYPSANGLSKPEGTVVLSHERNIMTRKYRDIGLRLWEQYPDHRQRYLWLYRTQRTYLPDYFADFVDGVRLWAAHRVDEARIDEQAQQEWQRRYAELKAELLDDPETTENQRRQIRDGEFLERMKRVAQRWRTQGDSAGVQALLRDIQDLYSKQGDGGSAATLAARIFQESPRYGLDDDALQAFIEPMLEAEHPSLREFAESRQRLLDLRVAGVDLEGTTLQGRPFDLQNLRGKIVLIDYWATSCSSCIAAMPRIHDIYERYQDRGFEVVSVCMDANEKRKKVERAEREMGLTWTTLAADELWPELKARYGYQGVPQYMLLDREGKLVAGTAEVDMGRNLEALLDEMLTQEAAEKTGENSG